MVIYKNAKLLALNILGYYVAPMKTHSTLFTEYQCELGEEDHYSVMAIDHLQTSTKLGEFKDQDKAYQFAELLTECLTKIKAFTDENI